MEFCSFQSENRVLKTKRYGFMLICMLNTRKLGTVKRCSLDSTVGKIFEHFSRENALGSGQVVLHFNEVSLHVRVFCAPADLNKSEYPEFILPYVF
jgi:hypothetical protein